MISPISPGILIPSSLGELQNRGEGLRQDPLLWEWVRLRVQSRDQPRTPHVVVDLERRIRRPQRRDCGLPPTSAPATATASSATASSAGMGGQDLILNFLGKSKQNVELVHQSTRSDDIHVWQTNDQDKSLCHRICEKVEHTYQKYISSSKPSNSDNINKDCHDIKVSLQHKKRYTKYRDQTSFFFPILSTAPERQLQHWQPELLPGRAQHQPAAAAQPEPFRAAATTSTATGMVARWL